jgi:hypothetical protein
MTLLFGFKNGITFKVSPLTDNYRTFTVFRADKNKDLLEIG